jgi:hypothetical protein
MENLFYQLFAHQLRFSEVISSPSSCINNPYLSQNTLGVHKVEAGVFSAFKEYSF